MSPQIALDRALAAALPEPKGVRIGAAVSGGGDSMALLVLLADWASRSGATVAVASVDHGLRAEAAAEIDRAEVLARKLGLTHDTLCWEGWDRAGNLQAAARKARYDLLRNWAHGRAVGWICLGHTRDDQAETLLMRLARGSGVDGLAAMAPLRRDAAGIAWLRPLLEIARADLRQVLRDRGLDWAEDPSNEDPRFDRIRARRTLELLESLGTTADGLAETAFRLRAARRVLAETAADAAEALADVDAGEILFRRDGFAALPDETRWRLFAAALCKVSGNPYRPRFDALRRTIRSVETGRRATLHGCLCQPQAGVLRIGRELAAANAPVAAPGLWDGRWYVDCADTTGLRAGALGEAGLAQRPDWRASGLPRETLLASPALWNDAKLHAALLIDRSLSHLAKPAWGKPEFLAFLLTD